MERIDTGIDGLIVIKPKVFRDERGFFLETYRESFLREAFGNVTFVQDNHARSEEVGVLRGLHFQLPDATQAKLVRVTRGAVYDVAVDLRVGSPTFGQWYGIELSADNFLQLFVPRGFAHGYKTLLPGTEFEYKVDAYYAPQLDAGIAWNDEDLAINWPGSEPILSEKDKALPRLKDFSSPFTY